MEIKNFLETCAKFKKGVELLNRRKKSADVKMSIDQFRLDTATKSHWLKTSRDTARDLYNKASDENLVELASKITKTEIPYLNADDEATPENIKFRIPQPAQSNLYPEPPALEPVGFSIPTSSVYNPSTELVHEVVPQAPKTQQLYPQLEEPQEKTAEEIAEFKRKHGISETTHAMPKAVYIPVKEDERERLENEEQEFAQATTSEPPPVPYTPS